MANSRANIYPVQLQGAELNLNKYDAEIKQYSGFNKNNAPFVGGCLSNIFTKDETIEGATSKNTYIAPNGDVYRVTNEGLFKNDTKLVDYTGKKFYNIEECKTQFPSNTVFVDSDYVYITADYNSSLSIVKYNFILNVYNFFTETWNDININFSQPETFRYNKQYIFDIKVFKNDNEILIFVAYKTFTKVFLNVYKTTENGTVNISNNEISSVNTQLGRFLPVILHLEKTSDNGGIVTVIRNSDDSNYIFGINYTFNLDGEITFLNNISNSEYKASENKLYLRHSLVGLASENLTYDYVIHNGELVTSNPLIAKWDADYRTSALDQSKSLAEQYGFISVIKKYNNDNSRFVCVGYCDFITNALTKNNDFYDFNTGALTGDYVLYNNGIVSGICLPGGIVLASEWNTVDKKNIYLQKYKQSYSGLFIGDACDIIYKTNDKWVKLKESIPELKIINNQIIINVNHYFNSFDIEANKKLLFAPAWNNRIPSTIIKNYNINVDNSYYVASSINEYNLADNPSIIINPVPTIYNLENNWRSINDNFFNNKDNNIYINFYCGSVEILYKGSLQMEMNTTFSNENPLLYFEYINDLPFPSNTDGNIQYSPSLFAIQKGKYGNLVFISEGGTAYKLMTYDNRVVMSYFLSTAIEGLQDFFTIQGQLYGIQNNQIYSFAIVNEVANRGDFIVSVEGLQFVGNTPYEALFFSKTNRCLYSFTGANVLNAKQFVDKISEVRNYKYNPATQSIFLITDIGVLVYSLFGVYQIDFAACKDMYLLNNGVILTDNEGTFKYVKYYKEETTDEYNKVNIQLDTCFYGMNNQTVTINDCLYVRLFSEEHEEGEVIISATTLKTEGRTTENTIFRINSSDWDAETHTYYLRYQPQEQRGVGISFKITSPFKIAALAVGSVPDAVLLDKASKYAINSPDVRSNNVEW